MKIGIVSDVHANLHAFEAVLDALARDGVQEIWNLGDTLGYNAHPQECLQRSCKATHLTLLGNHDWAALHGPPERFNPLARAGIEHSQASLGQPERAYLEGLAPTAERTLRETRFHLAHASLDCPLNTYVFPAHAPGLLQRFHHTVPRNEAHVILLGHTHQPMLATTQPVDPDNVGEVSSFNVRGEVVRREAPLLVVNPGSVGQPRDGDPRAAYALLDPDTLEVTFRRVAYDVEAAAEAILRAGLPSVLAERLRAGR